jgi:hypothetical protein
MVKKHMSEMLQGIVGEYIILRLMAGFLVGFSWDGWKKEIQGFVVLGGLTFLGLAVIYLLIILLPQWFFAPVRHK